MQALSYKQPWAWLILTQGKDIENRSWRTHKRGRVAVHASGRLDHIEYLVCRAFLRERGLQIVLPQPDQLVCGAILGTIEIVGCVAQSTSPWFVGDFGFQLNDPRLLAQPLPCKGKQGFWEVPPDLAAQIRQAERNATNYAKS